MVAVSLLTWLASRWLCTATRSGITYPFDLTLVLKRRRISVQLKHDLSLKLIRRRLGTLPPLIGLIFKLNNKLCRRLIVHAHSFGNFPVV